MHTHIVAIMRWVVVFLAECMYVPVRNVSGLGMFLPAC